VSSSSSSTLQVLIDHKIIYIAIEKLFHQTLSKTLYETFSVPLLFHQSSHIHSHFSHHHSHVNIALRKIRKVSSKTK
jgi:hypothetical protein